MKRLAAAIVLLLGTAHAGPREDLASPSQETRNAAAAKQRTAFKPAPRSKFTSLVAKIKKPGMTKDKTLVLLKPYRPQTEGAGASGGGETILYRIDDSWLLECGFSDRGDGKVLGVRLVSSIRDVWVEPPSDFTGTWKTYLANGKVSHEMHYEHGVTK